VYAVVNWRTAPGAASAGVLTGIIVFVIVPLLGLLAYCLVSLRRKHLDDDDGAEDTAGAAAAAGTPRGGKARGGVIGDTALSCGSEEEEGGAAAALAVEGVEADAAA
jgi:hypothetical protein